MQNGELVKSSRRKIGFTQQDLADYFEVDQPLIARWEANERPIPKKVLKMAKTIRRTNKKTAVARFKRTLVKHDKKQKDILLPHIKTQKSRLQTNTPLALYDSHKQFDIFTGGILCGNSILRQF